MTVRLPNIILSALQIMNSLERFGIIVVLLFPVGVAYADDGQYMGCISLI